MNQTEHLAEARKLLAHACEFAMVQLGDEWHERAGTLLALSPPPMSESKDARVESADGTRPAWMTCERRRHFVVDGIRTHAEQLRDVERRCRNAYRQDYMGVPTRYLADCFAEAAAALEARIASINAALEGPAS